MVHGGAGPRSINSAQRSCLTDALATGYDLLWRGGSALNAVEQAIRLLESSGLFNAGAGARLQLDSARRMDASLMEGCRLRAGSVAAIEEVRHPISAARLVMEKTAHVLLVGEHAMRIARHFKLERQPPPTKTKKTAIREIRAKGQQRQTLRLYKEICETVGAVAMDQKGSMAAGASTGGVALMLPGRVGDTPLIGCGVYADDLAGAISMTGLGEGIIRIVAAKAIADRLAAGASPATAARLTLKELDRRIRKIEGAGTAGALVLAPDGRFAIRHTTPRMAAGYWTGKGEPYVADRFPTR